MRSSTLLEKTFYYSKNTNLSVQLTELAKKHVCILHNVPQ